MLTGKPRPLLVVQRSFRVTPNTVTVCLISAQLSFETVFRLFVQPDDTNGLDQPSEVQVDRLFSFRPSNFERLLGRLSTPEMRRVDIGLKQWLDL